MSSSLPDSVAASPSASAAASPSNFTSTPYHQKRIALQDELTLRYQSLRVQPLSSRTLTLHTRLRDQHTDTTEFVHIADQLLRQLTEFALSTLETRTKTVQTPTLIDFVGCEPVREVCGISIVRAGEAMEGALRSILLGARIGKILIQRDESTAEKCAKFFYAKLPPQMDQCDILLLDPMLASGGSAICAIQHLLSRGVSLARITFVCLIASPEGITALMSAFPTLSLVTQILDHQIDHRKFILPGVGDFGDRYFGTVETVEKEKEFKTTNATIAE